MYISEHELRKMVSQISKWGQKVRHRFISMQIKQQLPAVPFRTVLACT